MDGGRLLRVAEPIDLTTDLGLARSYQWLADLAHRLHGEPESTEPARVLRLPDTLNLKSEYGSTPPVVTLLCADATAAYTLDQVIAVLGERQRLAAEIANLTKAIASGGDIPALALALSERDTRLKSIDAKLAKPVVRQDRETLKAALELRTADWRTILRGPHIAQARVVLQHLLELPIRVHNEPKPKWMAAARPEGLTVGLIQSVASLSTPSWNQILSFLRQMAQLRETAGSAA